MTHQPFRQRIADPRRQFPAIDFAPGIDPPAATRCEEQDPCYAARIPRGDGLDHDLDVRVVSSQSAPFP
jgi:hypothetical protein